ncbi:MAG: UDP-N-acetylmuramate dehydrogenase, partial [Oscillospiraceae bacterium]|nr:UDP-N-acetylmuramate dehydrogenase [Oscillospiraceae bacterium]
CRFAANEGLGGLEFAFGIPGSIGGAVFMNAGAYGGEMKDVVTSVTALFPDGEIKTVSAKDADFGYRHSAFETNGAVILSAEFELYPDDKAVIEEKMKDILGRRKDKQPLEWPSAGSAFKRPKNGFAAAMIDECGLKGFTIGGAQVSEKHAGFVINRGGATCEDVLNLLDAVKEKVFEKTGVMLEAEIKKLG